MSTIRLEVPKKIAWCFAKPSRYKCFFGGRGSGKSFSVAKAAAVYGSIEKLRILCTREFQNSLKESVFAEVKNAIESDPALAACYEIGANYIKGKNGTEFLFAGLHNNIASIKSMAKIDICLVEEAETVSEASWKLLIPTIRNEGKSDLLPQSEIWVIWNPSSDESPVYRRFIQNPPKNSRIVQVNYIDNPWFPNVLDEERKEHYINDPDTYDNVWNGGLLKHTKAQIFYGKWEIQDFEEPLDRAGNPLYDGPYYGTDFGFSQDPGAFVRCYVYDSCLYVTHEGGGKHIDMSKMVDKIYRKVPGYNTHTIRGDSSRPETISYLKNGEPDHRGVKDPLKMVSVDKWKGSVEDGIEHIKKYKKVIVHIRCKEVANELKLYSFKVDRLSGDILDIIVDKHNHYMDALRYALVPLMQRKRSMSKALAGRK
jgi:phage terminase large subunit